MNTNKLDVISPNAKLQHDETFPATCPLSEAQRAVYLDCLEDPGTDSYIVIYDNMITGDIDVKRFMDSSNGNDAYGSLTEQFGNIYGDKTLMQNLPFDIFPNGKLSTNSISFVK